MNDFPLITAAVPVFGTEQLLADCIQSIFEQDYPNLEIIITDDASCGTDSGGRTCAQITAALTEQGKSWNPPRTVYYQRHQENRGLVESRRDGTEAASGQYMFFADSDDLLPPAAVSTLYQEARQSGADIVHGCAELLGHTGLLSERARRKQEQRIAQIYPGLLDGADVFDGYLRLHNHSGFLWGKLYRRDLLAAAFSYIPETYCTMGEDSLIYFFISRFARRYSGISDIVYRYRVNSGITADKPITDIAQWEKVCSAASVFTILYDYIASHPITEEQKKAIQFKCRSFLANNIMQMRGCVAPELRRKAREILCDYWGEEFTAQMEMAIDTRLRSTKES